jgi:FkbM family methyltransferase
MAPMMPPTYVRGMKRMRIDASHSEKTTKINTRNHIVGTQVPKTNDTMYTRQEFVQHICIPGVKNIIECGACNGNDTIPIAKKFDAFVYAFECDPRFTGMCEKKFEKHPNVAFTPKALWSHDGTLTFHVVNPDKSKNKGEGISSAFKWTGVGDQKKNCPPNTIVQDEIIVGCVTLDTFCAKNDFVPQLLCLDTQGGELEILRGSTSILPEVKYIITEVNYIPQYQDECLFDEVTGFLKEHGFKLKHDRKCTTAWGDALFVRK